METVIDKTRNKHTYPKATGEVSKNAVWPCWAEIKYDGELEFIEYDNGWKVMNKARYGRVRTNFPVTEEMDSTGLPRSLVYVGELYYGEGKLGDLYKLLANKTSDDLKLAIFDVLAKDEYSVRRAFLERHFKETPHIHLSKRWRIRDLSRLNRVFSGVKKRGYEGLMVKNDSFVLVKKHILSSTGDQMKMKHRYTADLAVVGYKVSKEPALLLGWNNGKEWIPLSYVGLQPLSKEERADLIGALAQYKVGTSNGAVIVTPAIVVEVEHQGVTYKGTTPKSLRSPIFKRFRWDKEVSDISLL